MIVKRVLWCVVATSWEETEDWSCHASHILIIIVEGYLALASAWRICFSKILVFWVDMNMWTVKKKWNFLSLWDDTHLWLRKRRRRRREEWPLLRWFIGYISSMLTFLFSASRYMVISLDGKGRDRRTDDRRNKTMNVRIVSCVCEHSASWHCPSSSCCFVVCSSRISFAKGKSSVSRTILAFSSLPT